MAIVTIINCMTNIHTHCQVAQANVQTKTWQRVCLFQRKTGRSDNRTNEEEHRTGNSGSCCTTPLTSTHIASKIRLKLFAFNFRWD